MKYLITYIVLILIFFQTTQGQSGSEQPINIIWISVEDMGPILGAYGNKIVNTPNINRLAQEGVKYTNAYATVGVCAPSRFSIIT